MEEMKEKLNDYFERLPEPARQPLLDFLAALVEENEETESQKAFRRNMKAFNSKVGQNPTGGFRTTYDPMSRKSTR